MESTIKTHLHIVEPSDGFNEKDLELEQYMYIPTEPPVDNWKNSYIPSNTGQSSPTLTKMNQKESDFLRK